jgi:hypothetical protein
MNRPTSSIHGPPTSAGEQGDDVEPDHREADGAGQPGRADRGLHDVAAAPPGERARRGRRPAAAPAGG